MNNLFAASIEEKYLWPLAGVALGWMLTTFSARLKDRSERRRRVGALLSIFVLLRNQINVIIHATETYYKHYDDLVAYEHSRNRTIQKHLLEPESQVKALYDAIKEFSGDYPLDSLKLQGMVDSLLKSKTISLAEAAKNRDIYIKLISMHEVTLAALKVEIEKYVRKLAFRHGLITYFKLRYVELRIKKINTKNGKFLDDYASGLFKQIAESRTKE